MVHVTVLSCISRHKAEENDDKVWVQYLEMLLFLFLMFVLFIFSFFFFFLQTLNSISTTVW